MSFSNSWNIFVDNLSLFLDVSNKNDDVTVKIDLFQSVWVKAISNDNKKRLKHTSTYANICFTIDFMKELLLKIIHRQNGLQHFRSVVPEYNQLFHGVYLDLDYSKNLTIPMKQMVQSIHWTQETVSVHCGISKSKDGKPYYPYISNSKKHDQVLTKNAIEEILVVEILNSADVIIINGENCSVQYKSGHHFYHLQEIANVYDKTINLMYKILGNRKSEVDHVGGTVKVTVKWIGVTGHVFHNAKDAVEFLIDKYAE